MRTRVKSAATAFAIPFATAASVAAAPAVAQQAPAATPTPSAQPAGGGSPIAMAVADSRLRAGQRARVVGRVPNAGAGREVALEFRSPGRGWRVVARTRTTAGGRYVFTRRMTQSGRVRVSLFGVARASSTALPAQRSVERPVTVAALLRVADTSLDVLSGRTASVSGKLSGSGGRRRVVRLQLRDGRRWRTAGKDVVNAAGRFRITHKRRATGATRARLVFDGDRANAGAVRSLGELAVYRYAHASWYGPGLYGNTVSCGGRLHPGTLGVAHKTLPCGTKVRFRRGGRSITVRVIDRGPYVGGREYDLTAATANALGFRGHGPVLATR